MVNYCIMQGRLVADPEMRKTPSDVSVTTFRIAVQRKFANQNGERETDFFSVVTWRKTAEFVAKYFEKGHMIIVIGPMQTRKYTDKEENQRIAYELNAEEVHFCGKNDTSENTTAKPAQKPEYAEFSDTGELPF